MKELQEQTILRALDYDRKYEEVKKIITEASMKQELS